ncbi:MAG: hypothetical protein ACRCWQ_05325 [Bacilli bacterium]
MHPFSEQLSHIIAMQNEITANNSSTSGFSDRIQNETIPNTRMLLLLNNTLNVAFFPASVQSPIASDEFLSTDTPLCRVHHLTDELITFRLIILLKKTENIIVNNIQEISSLTSKNNEDDVIFIATKQFIHLQHGSLHGIQSLRDAYVIL